MGILNKILKVFQGNDDNAEENAEESLHSISLAEFEKWINEKTSADFNAVKDDIKEKISLIVNQKEELLSQLDELRDAQLKNEKIPEKEFQLMQGNREAFIKQYQIFSRKLKEPLDDSRIEIINHTNDLEENLDKIAKSTMRGSLILKEFFAKHTINISKTLKEVHTAVHDIKKLIGKGSTHTEGANKLIKELEDLRTKKKLAYELDHELSVLNQKLDNSMLMKDKLENNIEELKQSDEYSKCKSIEDEKEESKKEKKRIESEISNLFFQIDKPMRKYERIITHNVEVFQDYTRNAVSGLESDENLKILIILESLRKSVDDETLGFKDKDKDKYLSRIDGITKDKLTKLQLDISDIKGKIKLINNQISSSKVLQELDDFGYKLEHTNERISILNEKIERAEKSRNKIDLTELKKSLENNTQEYFDSEVSLNWDK